MPELGVIGWILVILALIFLAPFIGVIGIPLAMIFVAFILFKWIFRF